MIRLRSTHDDPLMLVPSRTFWHADTASSVPAAGIEASDKARIFSADAPIPRPTREP
jgi:hypothetical protein